MLTGILLPWTIPLEIDQSADPSQHSEADQYIKEWSVVASQPADDGGTVELTQVGNHEKADRATHGESGEKSFAWILHDSGRHEYGNHWKWRREYGSKKDGAEPSFFEFPINLLCLFFANFLFDFGLAAFFREPKGDVSPDDGSSSRKRTIVSPPLTVLRRKQDDAEVHAARNRYDRIVDEANRNEPGAAETEQPLQGGASG